MKLTFRMKKANVVRYIKKETPNVLLPFCRKVFEKIIYIKILEFFISKNLISSHQSGFQRGDSCVNQLLSIAHEIYHDEGLENRSVFLDVFKTFDKV